MDILTKKIGNLQFDEFVVASVDYLDAITKSHENGSDYNVLI